MGEIYKDSIKIGFATRSSLYYLPQAIKLFEQMQPDVQIIPEIQPPNESLTAFLHKELDLILLPQQEAQKLSGVVIHPLYISRIYLLCQNKDPLAQLDRVTAQDLAGRTLLINGGSSQTLRQVQQRVLNTVPLHYFNSPTHDFTLIQVASDKAICLSPGYLNDHSGAFAWIPFDCPESFDLVLVSHQEQLNPALANLIAILQELYDQSKLNL